MLLLVATAIAASSPPSAAGVRGASAQASATIRIIAGARLALDGRANRDAPAPRESTVHGDGVARRANLIEFE